MSGGGSKIGWMVVRTVSTVVAVTLTKKALDRGWRFVTGKEPPENKPSGDPDAALTETLVWVAASAIGIAAAQVVAARVAANRWQAWTGELPPGTRSSESKATDAKNRAVAALETKAKRAKSKTRKLKHKIRS